MGIKNNHLSTTKYTSKIPGPGAYVVDSPPSKSKIGIR
jgi:hypothetical protein